MEKLKQDGFAVLKLWTTEDPNENIAQRLYDSLGLKIISRGRRPGIEYKVLYRAKKL